MAPRARFRINAIFNHRFALKLIDTSLKSPWFLPSPHAAYGGTPAETVGRAPGFVPDTATDALPLLRARSRLASSCAHRPRALKGPARGPGPSPDTASHSCHCCQSDVETLICLGKKKNQAALGGCWCLHRSGIRCYSSPRERGRGTSSVNANISFVNAVLMEFKDWPGLCKAECCGRSSHGML